MEKKYLNPPNDGINELKGDHMNAIPKIAPILKITMEELERESLDIYLHIRLERCESELLDLARKCGVSSIEDFEEGYQRGNIEEEGTWEDFFRLDHLEAERESIRAALGVIR
uniref:Uncharacterized protein n=1 Tax=Candidatus Methanogaster sp. ANME-2c ERB4 TaxID=2759911 RepID=A0A7G9YMS9_9EURY|nr:hypothetical protein HONBAIEO_00007 [Methanosarcinales archaeon ANME-2c ERB4]QNO49435.1 hypothetical protein JHKIABMC_00041 [Methanosarcinales archaeon ANME-2c ERB4]